MKEQMKLRKHGQLTLPKKILNKFQLEEGDTIEIVVDQHGEIKLVPMIQIPFNQKWFWTDAWQEAEHEANEDSKSGRMSETFNNADDLIKSLQTAAEKEKRTDGI